MNHSKAFQTSRNRYLQKDLPYHNWQHIRHALQQLEKWQINRNQLTPLFWAIVLHDMYYKPQCTHNERRSERMSRRIIPFLTPQQRQACWRLIKSTQFGSTLAKKDEKIMHDIDYSILGSSPEQYVRYATAIRQEHGHICDATYREGRSHFLQSQMTQPMFQTKRGKKLWGKQAVQNIRCELTALEANRSLAAGEKT